jgi:acetolactate synthase-1/2/3 large subunit
LGRNFPASISIVADAKAALTGLLNRLKNTPRLQDRELQELIQKCRSLDGSGQLNGALSPNKVGPSKFLRALRRRLNRDAILTTDSGMHQFWALNDFPVYAPRSFLAPADYQAMGFSIPAAIGAKLTFPQRQVVSLVGDGGFLMSGFECLNAVKWGAGISIVVFRDGAWGLTKEAQKRLHRRTPFTDLPDFDLEKLASAFGMKFARIANEMNLERDLDALAKNGAPCLMEVNVDYSQSPPYVKAAGLQMFQNLPVGVRTKAGLRYLKRCIFPPRAEHS